MLTASYKSVKSLDDLIAYAERYAIFTMGDSGHLDAGAFILTQEGSLLLLPGKTSDKRAKNEFAKTARLVCIAHPPTAVVFVGQAWMSRNLKDLTSEKRQEIVMLMGEAQVSYKQKLLPVIRTESGTFSAFGDSALSALGKVEGRFSRILPPRAPTMEDQATARNILKSAGVILLQLNSLY